MRSINEKQAQYVFLRFSGLLNSILTPKLRKGNTKEKITTSGMYEANGQKIEDSKHTTDIIS